MYLWTKKFTLNFETRPHLERNLGTFKDSTLKNGTFIYSVAHLFAVVNALYSDIKIMVTHTTSF